MNQDLRNEMKRSGIRTMQMAKKLGTSYDAFEDLLESQLNKQARKRIREAIEELSPYDGEMEMEYGSEKSKKRKARRRRTKRHPDGARLSDHTRGINELWE